MQQIPEQESAVFLMGTFSPWQGMLDSCLETGWQCANMPNWLTNKFNKINEIRAIFIIYKY